MTNQNQIVFRLNHQPRTLSPLLRQRNPQSRQQASERLVELAELGAELRAVFVRSALREHLDDVAVLELTYITSLYAMHAVMSRALRTEFDDVEDPVTEVPAPGPDQTFRV